MEMKTGTNAGQFSTRAIQRLTMNLTIEFSSQKRSIQDGIQDIMFLYEFLNYTDYVLRSCNQK